MIVSAQPEDLPAILRLLRAAGLPYEDLGPEMLGTFVVARRDEDVIGSGGFELFGDAALLRSVAVDPTVQSGGLGSRLVDALESRAEQLGVSQIFLLTTTATQFFQARGYRMTQRADAPSAIRSSTQFSTLCPDTASFMRKKLREDA